MGRLARYAGVRLFRFFARPLEAEAGSARPPGLQLRALDEPDVAAYQRRDVLRASLGAVPGAVCAQSERVHQPGAGRRRAGGGN